MQSCYYLSVNVKEAFMRSMYALQMNINNNYNNRQWPTLVCWILDTQTCFDTRMERLATRSKDCVKKSLSV